MSTNELNTIARDLKELRLMAEQLDAEIKTLEDTIKAHMTETGVDTLITTDTKITWKTVTSSRIDTTALKKQLPDVAAVFTKEPPLAASLSSKLHNVKWEACKSFPFCRFGNIRFNIGGKRNEGYLHARY